MTLRLAWFATARGTSSRLLLERTLAAIRAGALDAEIVVVFCNRIRGQASNTDAFLDEVEAARLPLITLSSSAWRERAGGERSEPGADLAAWRSDFDAEVYRRIIPYGPTVGVLAGYMLITTAALCDRLPLLNLHPAAPGGPVGTWQDVIRALIDSGATESGIMIQRATTALDAGPIVSACRYPIRGGALDALWAARQRPATEEEPLFQAIRQLGVVREPPFLVESLRAIAQGRVALPPSGRPGPALDLTAEVEAAVRQSAL